MAKLYFKLQFKTGLYNSSDRSQINGNIQSVLDYANCQITMKD